MNLEELRKIEYNQQYISSMRPVFNRRALFADTSEHFVNPSEPAPYAMVEFRFRTAKNNVDRVFWVHKGQPVLMVKEERDGDFDYYIYDHQLDNEPVHYHFLVESGKMHCCYDVRGGSEGGRSPLRFRGHTRI